MFARLNHLRILIGVCLIILIIYFINIKTILSHIAQLNTGWLVAVFSCILISSMIGAFNIYILINKGGAISFREFLPIYWLSWSFNLIVPGQIGDIASIAALLRKYNINWHTSIGKSLVDKVNSLLVTFIYGLIGVCWIGLLPEFNITLFVLTFIGLVVTGAVFFYYKASLISFNHDHASGFKGFFLATIKEVFLTVHEHPYHTSLNLFLTFLKLGITGFSYWCVFNALNLEIIDFLLVIFLASASSLVAYIPISFNGVGTVEISAIYLFTKAGLNASLIFTAYIILRCVVFISAWVPSGLWLLFKQKIK